MSLKQIKTAYINWLDTGRESTGYTLDYMLDVALKDVDKELIEYIKNVDGDEMSDEEAIELIYVRYRQLVKDN